MNQDQFTVVPETTLPSGIVVPQFEVSTYACTRGPDDKAASIATDKPWTSISYHKAAEACIKAGYKLITEKQWLAMAYNASQQAGNWTKGEVGSGKLFRGIRKGLVSAAQPGDYTPTNPKERRWLTLSNGEKVCDINGNVWQWVFDDVQGDDKGVIASKFAADSISTTTPPHPNREKGMGDYSVSFFRNGDWSGNALFRGSYWLSGSAAGVFALDDGSPDYRGDRVGFRCTR